jgi:integrase
VLSNPIENEERSGYKAFRSVDLTQQTINFFNNKDVSCSANSDSELVGGINQVWKEILEEISQSPVEQLEPHKGVEDMVNCEYETLKNNFNRLNCPITLNPQESTFDDVAIHALLRQRLSPSTVKKRMRYARFMENHLVAVDFRNPTFENFIRHADYREQIENAGASALANEWKTMKTFLKSYGMQIWDYRPPTQPKSKAKKLPFPDQVHRMIHYSYSKDKYVNSLIQYILLHTFMIGWRNPSETCIMKTTDVDIDNGLITITESKKYGSTRVIAPESIMMTGKNVKSFKYLIDNIRPTVENQYSNDFLYLKPNGKPFDSKEQLRMFLNRHVKSVFPGYSPYISRHWCATGLLIKEYIKTKHWNRNRVQNWLGHENENQTNTYVRSAEQYMRIAPYDWFKRVLKCTKIRAGENTLKISKVPFLASVNKIPSRKGHGPMGIRTR